jgi:DNA topoisomerase-3
MPNLYANIPPVIKKFSGGKPCQFKKQSEASEAKTSFEKLRVSPLKLSKKSTKTISRPTALNTVHLLKYCTKNFGMSSHNAMSIAERLYLRGFLTYPRTETTSYPKNFNFKNLVEKLSNYDDHRISSFSSNLLKQGKLNPKKGKDHGDHPPITITSNIPQGLSGVDELIYEYVASHFLASIALDTKYEEKTYSCQIGEVTLSFSEKKLIEPGFKEISKNTAWRNEYM